MADPHASSMFENPDMAPEELAARMLVTPTALDDLTLADAMKVVGYMRLKGMSAGTVFIEEGEIRKTDYMMLVLEGDIAVESELLGLNESMVVSVIGPGHLIGEMGVLDGAPRSAATNIVVAVLTRTALMRLLRDEPRVGARLLLAISTRMAQRLRDTTRKLRTFAQMNKAMHEEMQVVMNNRSGLGRKRNT